jgi:hypothetical protein
LPIEVIFSFAPTEPSFALLVCNKTAHVPN